MDRRHAGAPSGHCRAIACRIGDALKYLLPVEHGKGVTPDTPMRRAGGPRSNCVNFAVQDAVHVQEQRRPTLHALLCLVQKCSVGFRCQERLQGGERRLDVTGESHLDGIAQPDSVRTHVDLNTTRLAPPGETVDPGHGASQNQHGIAGALPKRTGPSPSVRCRRWCMGGYRGAVTCRGTPLQSVRSAFVQEAQVPPARHGIPWRQTGHAPGR
jgi:hypothetical protein